MKTTQAPSPAVAAALARLQKSAPPPCFWLLGKTQSGKTSIVHFLTGAPTAVIGEGWQPCTRTTRQYPFPEQELPLLTFLDTRGLDEAGHDPQQDIEQLKPQAHVVLAVVKALDHSQETLFRTLEAVRREVPRRPVLLVFTCLHEAYPGQQHPPALPVQFQREGNAWRAKESGPAEIPGVVNLVRSLNVHLERFGPLADGVVAVDLTRAEEGFVPPDLGGAELLAALREALPTALGAALLHAKEAHEELRDAAARDALPYVWRYSSLAMAAGALPIPWIDLLLLPAIQSRMVFHLARLYGQPLSARRFMELAGTLGFSLVTRQAIREFAKFIPYVGMAAGATLAGASTYALGKAFCWYLGAQRQGLQLTAAELRERFQAELSRGEALLKAKPAGTPRLALS